MTFYFYDLETSGIDARQSRIMQFAGQRTDVDLQQVGEPDSLLIKMTDDTLPDPDAIMVTGITPQQTRQDGITEAEFLKYFTDHIATPDTVMVGFNSIRFDDEFVRFCHYRNFYDAYEWQWKDGRSRWDILDVARMTRALRPEGIKWPFGPDGKASNRLGLLSSVNKLEHSSAHDALSDVKATLAVARLIKAKQPKLFDYLLSIRDKRSVAKLVDSGQPFVYSSGRYSSQFEKTTVAVAAAPVANMQGVIVYDLRHDPSKYVDLSVAELSKLAQAKKPDDPRLPAKILQYNRSPAVAPLGVLDKSSRDRLKLDLKVIEQNLEKLRASKDFSNKLSEVFDKLRPPRQASLTVDEQQVDTMLYDGFVSDEDKTKMSVVRAADGQELADLHMDFSDERLKLLLPLYKARNFPRNLSDEEQQHWQQFCSRKMFDGGDQSRAVRFFRRLEELSIQKGLTSNQRYLLKELELYAQSILPIIES